MNTQTINRYFESIAWGALFVWWGILELVKGLPNGVRAIGIGLILIGLNVARALNRIPTSGFTTFFGLLALVWGGLELARVTLGLPFEISVFPILLIVFGMLTLVRELTGNKSQQTTGLRNDRDGFRASPRKPPEFMTVRSLCRGKKCRLTKSACKNEG